MPGWLWAALAGAFVFGVTLVLWRRFRVREVVADESDDGDFYAFDRFVTHIDEGAISAVGALYDELDYVA